MTELKPVPRQAVLIVNTHSRKGRELFRAAREKLVAAGIELIAARAIRDPAKLTEAVCQAVAEGAPMVIVGGGDGSLSSAVDYVVNRDCVFALLPFGTANSFARTLGIPLDLDGAVATIANGRRLRVDVGAVNGDYFVNSAAIGLSPMVGDSVPQGLKSRLGRIGYLVWAAWCLARFRPFRLTVEEGDRVTTLSALEVRIANGRYHGGVEVVDEAGVRSGDIVVQAVTGRNRARLVWNWLVILLRLPLKGEVTEDFRGQCLRIVTHPPLPISIDGEVTARTPATVEVARKAIEVVVPNPSV